MNLSGEELRKLRHGKRLTIAELAQKVNVAPKIVVRWEYDIAVPSRKQLEAIGNVFGFSCNGLVEGVQIKLINMAEVNR